MSRKLKFHENLTRIADTVHEYPSTFMTVSRSSFLTMRIFPDKICTENQNTYFIFENFSRKSCRLWENVDKFCTAGQATNDNEIGRMRIACYINEATNTHLEYARLTASPLQQWLRQRVSALRCTHIACLVRTRPDSQYFTQNLWMSLTYIYIYKLREILVLPEGGI